jgi:hypothetical protein
MFRCHLTSCLGVIANAVCLFVMTNSSAWAADQTTSAPRPIPLTRPEMKQYLEDMKQRTPRIPLPELTEEEKTKLGERGTSYESRIRALYMPAGDSRGGFFGGGGTTGGTGGSRTEKSSTTGTRSGTSGQFGRESDPAMTLDYRFKTQLFWIVSRTNNCQY